MISFRKWTLLCAASLQFIILSACNQIIQWLGSPLPAAEIFGSSHALWMNTFPPIKSNAAALRFAHYGLEQGLSQSSVMSLLQDDPGFLIPSIDVRNSGSDHYVNYTNLPGGMHTLRVQATNSDGAWNEEGAAIRITIVSPVWQTWPFLGLTGIALIAAAIVTYRCRVRGIQAQKVELERIIQERTQVLKKQNLELEALISADEKMLRALTRDEVLQALVDVAVDSLQADKSAIFTGDPSRRAYVVRVSRGFRRATVDAPDFVRTQQIIISRIVAGEPLIIRDCLDDSEWKPEHREIVGMMSAENIRSLLFIPIKVQGMVLGVFNVCSSRPGAFDENRQRLFTSLVQRAALSIENSQMFERTRHLAILDERNRLAQELHDSLKQKAFAALAQVGAAKRKMTNTRGDVAEHLVEAENAVSEVIHDLTFFIEESHPKGLKERGLAVCVRDYAFTWESRTSVQLHLSILGERRLSLYIEQLLYRIVQEGLSNIARHSHATRADIHIVYKESEIQIQIGDNGKGFDWLGTSRGLGLQLMHERLRSIRGQVDIRSSPGGTWLDIRAPIQMQGKGAGYE